MKSFIIFTALFLTTAVIAGGDRGGGGGVVLCCRPSKLNNLKGCYTWDYYATKWSRKKGSEYNFGSKKSCNDNLKKIQKRLRGVNSKLAKSLGSYIKGKIKGRSNRPKRSWKQATIKRTYDEQRSINAPINCAEYENGSPKTYFPEHRYALNMQQAIVRVKKRGQIVYKYNKLLLTKIEKRPLQCSYLHIHEWLRDFIDDADRINYVTSYLHSKRFFSPKTSGKMVLKDLFNRGAFNDIKNPKVTHPCIYQNCKAEFKKLKRFTGKFQKILKSIINNGKETKLKGECKKAVAQFEQYAEELGKLPSVFAVKESDLTRLKINLLHNVGALLANARMLQRKASQKDPNYLRYINKLVAIREKEEKIARLAFKKVQQKFQKFKAKMKEENDIAKILWPSTIEKIMRECKPKKGCKQN